MSARIVRTEVFAVGAIDWDRTLFDALIPLPQGTSYNSYLIRGSEKIALIDTVDPSKSDVLINNIRELGIERLDYIIANHAEQDHSGSQKMLIELFPDVKIVTNAKCKEMLQDMYEYPDDRFLVIEDNGKLSLGDKTLRFIFAPWVHWPETMLTYLEEDRILFTCDLFGSHLATSDLYVENPAEVYIGAKRYYAEIMMPFRRHIRGHLERIRKLELELIAPSHGPIYGSPEFILDAYDDWASEKVKNEVVIGYVSMHETTKHMVDYLIDRLMERHIRVKRFNLVTADIGEFAISLVDAATLIIATPTVLVGPHPHAAYAALIANELRPKTKFMSVVGSYGWGGKMLEQLQTMLTNVPAEFIEPVIAKSHKFEEAFAPLGRLADDIAKKHSEIGIK